MKTTQNENVVNYPSPFPAPEVVIPELERQMAFLRAWRRSTTGVEIQLGHVRCSQASQQWN